MFDSSVPMKASAFLWNLKNFSGCMWEECRIPSIPAKTPLKPTYAGYIQKEDIKK